MYLKIIKIFVLLFTVSFISGQQTLNKTLSFNGELRSYTVYIPALYDGTESVPLLFNFHGGSDNIESQINISDMRPLSDENGFILVYPQALGDPGDGGSTNWTHKQPTEHDDTKFVEAMIESLSSEYLINSKKIYGCGYSNGGEFAFELACRLSDKIAAIGVVARSMFIDTYEQCSPTHPTAVLTIHGTDDEYEGIVWAGITYYISLDEVNEYWSNYNETDEEPIVNQIPNTNMGDGSTVEHHIWNNGHGCVSVEHFKVIGGGHDWPGNFGNMDIDATEEIWNFVSRHDINGLINCSTTSIDNNIKTKLTFYPNPVIDKLTIEISTLQMYEIYSIDGKLLLKGSLNSAQNTIDLTSLKPSVYILKIEDKLKKFIKSN